MHMMMVLFAYVSIWLQLLSGCLTYLYSTVIVCFEVILLVKLNGIVHAFRFRTQCHSSVFNFSSGNLSVHDLLYSLYCFVSNKTRSFVSVSHRGLWLNGLCSFCAVNPPGKEKKRISLHMHLFIAFLFHYRQLG